MTCSRYRFDGVTAHDVAFIALDRNGPVFFHRRNDTIFGRSMARLEPLLESAGDMSESFDRTTEAQR